MNTFQVKTLKRKLENHNKGTHKLSDYDKSFVENLLSKQEANSYYELTSNQNSYLNKIGGRS